MRNVSGRPVAIGSPATEGRGFPCRWFVRSSPYACVCPAPFFASVVPAGTRDTWLTA